MTRDSDFKALVRRRMRAENLTYTTARQALLTERAEPTVRDGEVLPRSSTAYERARKAHKKVVATFTQDGRLASIPAKRKVRSHILLDLVQLFEPGREYAEIEVNEILKKVYPDFAYLRRELVNYGYLVRNSGIYSLPSRPPIRSGVLAREIPDWEILWLPGYLSG